MGEYLTYRELSKKLKYSISTLKRWVKEDKIPYLKFHSGGIRFRESQIEPWLKKKEKGPEKAGG